MPKERKTSHAARKDGKQPRCIASQSKNQSAMVAIRYGHCAVLYPWYLIDQNLDARRNPSWEYFPESESSIALAQARVYL